MSPHGTPGGSPAPRPAHPAGSLLDRIQAHSDAPLRPGLAERLLAEAEGQVAPFATELARLGFVLRPATACGTLWLLHCTITGRPASLPVTAFQVRRALEGFPLDRGAGPVESGPRPFPDPTP